MWAFYVNRGQGLCSFGIQDKDHAMLEFLPANWAYEMVFHQGFRTFLKIQEEKKTLFYEPFQSADPSTCSQTFEQSSQKLTLTEVHKNLDLSIRIEYSTIPQEVLPVLVRTLSIQNLSKQKRKIEVVDGLPTLVPYGIGNFMLKEMRYLAKSYALVEGLSDRLPRFHAKSSTQDAAVVEAIQRSTFNFGFAAKSPHTLLQPIVDRTLLFGLSTDLRYPEQFMRPSKFNASRAQQVENEFPSAFLHHKTILPSGKECEIHSFFGQVGHLKELHDFVKKAQQKSFLSTCHATNKELVEGLSQRCATISNHEVFDSYARQNALDNLLRGGTPMVLSNQDNKKCILSIYSRKHGDLERDYNSFLLQPTYFSQGEGNYRDVLQNRRHDIFFNPEIDSEPILTFMNLLQADGYNPLVVKPKRFSCKNSTSLRKCVQRFVKKPHIQRVLKQLTTHFDVGELFTSLECSGSIHARSRNAFLSEVLTYADPIQPSVHGKDSGYWIDHWTYNLDLLESYQSIYPDKYLDLLFNLKEFYFCDTEYYVKSRFEKYTEWNGDPVQVDSVGINLEKHTLITNRVHLPYAVRTNLGKGEVYYTTLFVKLLSLAVIKLASLDAHGLGIEMEAERPGWNDALNGLPGRFGSSTCETFELKRLLLLLKEIHLKAPRTYQCLLPIEMHVLFKNMLSLLVQSKSKSQTLFSFWEKASTYKETYRASSQMGFHGDERSLKTAEISSFIRHALQKVDAGLRRSKIKESSLVHTYYWYELPRYKMNKEHSNIKTILAPGFRKKTLPLFLEGQVHALRLEQNQNKSLKIIEAIKESPLFDQTLKMYKLNASLKHESHQLGRARTFTPGWLENESIWLHMQYKYLLEVLKAGHIDLFYKMMKKACIPFLNPETYGRSVVENSSFIISEAHPDKKLVGKGYMARLSGATAEFIHIWMIICAGDSPFRLNKKKQLLFTLSPILPSWLFTKKTKELTLHHDKSVVKKYVIEPKSFAFIFLNHTLVVYKQKGRLKHTYGNQATKIQSYELVTCEGEQIKIMGSWIPEPYASAIREKQIARIHVLLH